MKDKDKPNSLRSQSVFDGLNEVEYYIEINSMGSQSVVGGATPSKLDMADVQIPE